MAITKRIIQVFKADIHGIIDCFEEPEAMLKQAIREMEEEIAEGEAELKTLGEHQESLARLTKQCSELKTETEKQIELCFDANNESLSRNFIRRKLECDQRLKYLAQKTLATSLDIGERHKKLGAQREKLASVREKMEIFCRSGAANTESKPQGDDFFVSEEQVEVALLEEQRKRKQAAAEGDKSRRAAQ